MTLPSDTPSGYGWPTDLYKRNSPDTNLYRIGPNHITMVPEEHPEWWIRRYVYGEIEVEELERELHRLIVTKGAKRENPDR